MGKVGCRFRIIKCQFGFVKARYKGLLKNDNQLAMLFALANLVRVDQMIKQWERSTALLHNSEAVRADFLQAPVSLS